MAVDVAGMEHFRLGEPLEVLAGAVNTWGMEYFRLGEPFLGLPEVPPVPDTATLTIDLATTKTLSIDTQTQESLTVDTGTTLSTTVDLV